LLRCHSFLAALGLARLAAPQFQAEESASTSRRRGNIITRGLIAIAIKAAVTVATVRQRGQTGGDGQVPGLRSFRHFFASWCINRKADGGPELPPEVVAERLGHSSIGMTMEVDGQLFLKER
jgi:integrase